MLRLSIGNTVHCKNAKGAAYTLSECEGHKTRSIFIFGCHMILVMLVLIMICPLYHVYHFRTNTDTQTRLRV